MLRCAWRHFDEPGPVVAFLNAQHEQLYGRPLHLAVESDEGLMRVEGLLEEMTFKALNCAAYSPQRVEPLDVS